MPIIGKRKGSRRERLSRDLLIKRGAEVQKAGGSLGALDLIALWPEEHRLEGVQVKSNRFPGSAEMKTLAELARRFSMKNDGTWIVVIDRWMDRAGVERWIVHADGTRELLPCIDLQS
jgi:hypothetical protein